MKKERAKLGKPAKPSKGIVYALLGFASIVIVLGLLHAQTFLIGGQSRPPDSFVQVAADSQGLAQVAPEDLPRGGTYWWVMPNGCAVPTPFLPRDLNGPVYQITDAQFLVDTTGGQVAVNSHPFALHRQTTANTVATIVATQTDAVVNLINQIQTREYHRQLRATAMAMGIPSFGGGFGGDGGGDGGSGEGFTSNYVPYTFDTNGLWLGIPTVSNGVSYVNLNNATNQVYAILTTTNLLGSWQVETEVWPTNTAVMPFTAQNADRPILFFRAMDWTGVTENENTTPDWWLWQYFGTTAVADTNLDYSNNGNTFAQDYASSNTPTVFSYTGIEVANNNVNASAVPVQLDVAGNPYYVAVLVDNTNFNNAVWNTYSSANVTVNLGSTEGWHDVWVGLRGHADATNAAVWQWRRLKLTVTPPLLVITNPTPGSVTAKPMIQLYGFSPEPLAALTFDVVNASGSLTNQTGYIVNQFYDRHALDITTNWFECLDLALAQGTNYVTLHAVDRAGNVTRTNLLYVFSTNGVTTPPVLTLTWPSNGARISGTNFTLRGMLDNETATVMVQVVDTNGITNTVTGLVERDGKFWAENLPLTGGTNNVTVTATDAAGNTSTNSINVVESDLVLTVNPLSDSQLNQLVTSVSGTVSDPSYVVWVNGIEATNMDEAGNWNVDGVPINSGGTASFAVTAYPVSEAPAAAVAKWVNPPSPNAVQTGWNQDKPPQVYIQHYDMPDYHSQVGPYYWLRFVPVMEDLQQEWTWAAGGDAQYNFLDGYGHMTNVVRGYYDDTWPVDAWPPTLGGTQISTTETNTVGAPSVSMEQCDIQGTDYIYNDADEKVQPVQYNRTANTVVRLFTGGKNVPGQYYLHALSVSLFQQAFNWWFGGGSVANVANIAPGATAGVFGTVGTDNLAYQRLANGRDVVITPVQSGVAEQGGDLPVDTRFKLQISYNGVDITDSNVTVIVGQKISLTCSLVGPTGFTPPIITNFTWTVPGYAISNYDVGSGTLAVSFPITNSTVNFYWVDGGQKKVSCDVTSAGQTLTAQAIFNVVRPTATITPVTSGTSITSNAPENYLRFLVKNTNGGYTDGIIFYNTLSVPPGFTGSAVWSQIFTSYEKKITDNKGQVHTAVQDCVCPLEDAAPYGPHLTGTANFTPVDSPGVPLLSYLFDAVSVNHTFKMTMLFQPANGIAVPLMAVDWQWQASATNANNLGWQIVGQPINGNPSVSPTTIFPQWNCKINLDPNWNPPL